MIRVRVYSTHKKTTKEQEFLFRTLKEGAAFTAGLRVADAWQKGERLYSATVEPAPRELRSGVVPSSELTTKSLRAEHYLKKK